MSWTPHVVKARSSIICYIYEVKDYNISTIQCNYIQSCGKNDLSRAHFSCTNLDRQEVQKLSTTLLKLMVGPTSYIKVALQTQQLTLHKIFECLSLVTNKDAREKARRSPVSIGNFPLENNGFQFSELVKQIFLVLHLTIDITSVCMESNTSIQKLHMKSNKNNP